MSGGQAVSSPAETDNGVVDMDGISISDQSLIVQAARARRLAAAEEFLKALQGSLQAGCDPAEVMSDLADWYSGGEQIIALAKSV